MVAQLKVLKTICFSILKIYKFDLSEPEWPVVTKTTHTTIRRKEMVFE